MAVTTEYTFEYVELTPAIRKAVLVDNEKVDESIVDVSKELTSLPTETLQAFSVFITEQYDLLSASLKESGLNQYTYNELVEPIGLLCRTRTGVDAEVDKRLNPPPVGPVNPFLPSE